MLTSARTNFSLTERARKRLVDCLAEPFSYPVVLGLLFGQDVDTGENRWRIGYYDRRTAEGPNFMGLLLRIDGIEVILPQPSVLDALTGMRLDWDGSGYSLKKAE